MKNIILYCRVSSEEQKENTSLAHQEEMLRKYCSNHKPSLHVIGCYHEDFSGKDYYLKRPEMKAIYQFCKKNKGKVDGLLFLRWDRFARNAEFAFTYIRKFKELGVSVNSIENPVECDDTKNSDWSTLIGVYCGNAQAEDNKISKRTRDGIHQTLKNGKCSNRAPRGYKNRHNELGTEKWVEKDKDVAPLISKIFEEVAKGVESPCRIRKRLCPQIAESSFFDMLRNPFYMGKVRVPAYGDDKEQIVNGQHEAIVKEEVFYRVQDIIDGKKKNPKLTGNKFIHPDLFLRKFLICPICGHALTGSESKGNGGKYAYYHCCHDGKHIRKRAEEVNESFARYLSCLTPNETILQLYEKILFDIRDEKNVENRKEAEKLREQLNTNKKRIERAKDMYIDGELSKTEKDEAVTRYQKEIEILQQRIDILTTPNRGKVEPKIRYSISLLDNMERFIRDAPVETKIKLLGSIFPEKIEFDGKNYRTNGYNKVLDLIYQQTNELREPKKENEERFDSFPASVPRAGVEPARVTPLVFETSASTDSAIWAFCGAKLHIFSETANF